jgi:hypothetical protein
MIIDELMISQGLPKPVKSLPEHIPRLLWVPAHKNVRVIPDGVVLDPVGNRKVAGYLTGRKDRLEVGAQKTCGDNGLRRRIAVPAQPMRI